MANPCTAYLIDPVARTVTEVKWNGDYRHIAELLGADVYDAARINRKGDAIFVDDEGLLKDGQTFFLHTDYPHPLAGKGLVLGCNAEGESVAPSVTIEDVRSKVTFGSDPYALAAAAGIRL